MRCSSLLPALLTPVLLLAGCAATPRAAMLEPPLAGTTFGSVKPAKVETLVIVVHDDTDTAPSHAGFAERAAAAIPDAAVVALLRPGYGSTGGIVSPGLRGAGNGDAYTAEIVRLLGETVAAHRQRYPRARTILVGDGGGAALVANLAGTRPRLVDGMLLVGCPCTLPEWRAMMAKARPGKGFNRPVESLDPLQTVGGIAVTTRTAIMVGENDRITPPRIAGTYAEALALRGIAIDFRRLPGRGHDILNDTETLQALARLARPVPSQVATR
ncbi:alpha/beta hydrolase [Sphingomonas qomolangmaensis]|uniref:Lysophospholipase n=1 Tax=Sphingomonas qomolangmaensis TaxID=2918765 RepID=A0ABY5L7R7_9SPHN|nr:lysophospholipase [Sphingomonas qomolangmaensis]UUL83019.1 lysophospholipase [Sphingomonas qomolangmaensis]